MFQKLFTLLIVLITFSCFSPIMKNQITVATISLTGFDCVKTEIKNEPEFDDCYNELNKVMKSIKGIKEYEMFIDTSHNHKIILINIVYNNKITTIEIINDKIKSNGYTVTLEMNE